MTTDANGILAAAAALLSIPAALPFQFKTGPATESPEPRLLLAGALVSLAASSLLLLVHERLGTVFFAVGTWLLVLAFLSLAHPEVFLGLRGRSARFRAARATVLAEVAAETVPQSLDG